MMGIPQPPRKKISGLDSSNSLIASTPTLFSIASCHVYYVDVLCVCVGRASAYFQFELRSFETKQVHYID